MAADDVRSHELKCWPEYFAAILDGSKPFEYRRNDRGFRVGDTLRLREWEPCRQCMGTGRMTDPDDGESIACVCAIGMSFAGDYTGREVFVRVTYVLGDNGPGVPTDYCVMGIVRADIPPADVDGAALIAAERARQVDMNGEGWTAAHDDEHRYGEMAIVAAKLAVSGTDASVNDPHDLQWVRMDDKTIDRRLVIAGALLAAEIDRLRRTAPPEEAP
jgi:uncharacterized protein DUF3850